MTAAARRQALLEYLRDASEPCSASALAARFQVSRQVIVGDVALLRAGGEQITATPRGYLLQAEKPAETYTVACQHSADQMGPELYAMVDNGCTVLDVIVEHPVYGQLAGQLHCSSRYDVDAFLAASAGSKPLSLLTGGIHLHTLLCPDEASYRRVLAALDALGVLVK